jgi:hypothetical protein
MRHRFSPASARDHPWPEERRLDSSAGREGVEKLKTKKKPSRPNKDGPFGKL